jgi:hypothetical protein
MKEESYFILRKFFFWLMLFIFLFFAPLIVFYSLGYKFDESARKFLKTGAISIKTSPWGAEITLNNEKTGETTPAIFRELLPKKYSVALKKTGFYPYQMSADVKPWQVSELNVVLVPERKNVEKLKYAYNIYRFFVNPHFFGRKLTIFTDQGIYLLDLDLKNPKKVSSQDLGQEAAAHIENLRYWNDHLIFWSKDHIWMADVPQSADQPEKSLLTLYKAKSVIKEVFLGFRDRYLIVHDGPSIVAVDVLNPEAYFQVFVLNSPEADIFYDGHSDVLYVRDRLISLSTFSVFKIELLPIISEKNERRETQKIP